MSSKKQVRVGNVFLGKDAPVAVQSMLSTPAHDKDACVEQAKRLEKAGKRKAGWAAVIKR